LSAAPPPSVMVDLVDDPWKAKPPPEQGPGGQPADMSSSPPPSAQPPSPPSAVGSSTPQAAAPSSQASVNTPAPASKPAARPPAAQAAAQQSPAPQPAASQPPAPIGFPSFDASEANMVTPGTPTGLRIAQMLQVPVELPVDAENLGGGGAAELGADIVRSAVDGFKEHLQSCWKTPPEAVGDDRIKILIRVGLRRDGSIVGEPTLVQAVATPAGPAMVKSAIAAVRDCQPYAFLPAELYQEWRALDVAFSAKGVM
jgi:hypothetical protein